MSDGLKVIIFGAGIVGIEFFYILERAGINVLGFMDNYAPLDKPVAGKPVWRPSEAPAYIHRDSIAILIGVRRRDVSPVALENGLRGHGYENISRTLGAFIRRHDLGDIFWGTEPGFYDRPDRVAAMERARHIWVDAKSRQVYERLLAFRKSFDDSFLMPPDDNEYFPDDIPAWPEPIRFVDGGAFTGDTVTEMVKRGYNIEAVAAFEPDPANFERLVSSRHDFPIFRWPCALGRANEMLRFQAEKFRSIGSAVSPAGNIQVPCVTLDSALHNFRPTLIKLDVEGAELVVLEGAEELLRSAKPGWAVCVYHRAEDLWEIPLWFADHTEKGSYGFYLRDHNAGGTNDHCFYAIPRV